VKKLIVLVCLAALMCFGFVGCKEEGSTMAPETTVAPAEEAAAPAVEEAAPAVEEVAPAAEEAAPATH
jgi:hypothetical protein